MPRTIRRNNASVRTRTLYEKLVEGFRQAPGNYSFAGKFAGVEWKTAKIAYHEGWPRFAWAIPIERVIAEERERTLAAVADRLQKEKEAADEMRAKASLEETSIRADEEMMMKAARQNVRGMLGISAELYQAWRAYAGKIRDEVLRRDGFNKDGSERWVPKPAAEIKVSAETAARMIERGGKLLGRSVDLAMELVAQGRLDRGLPTERVSHILEQAMTPEQAAEQIEEQDATLELLRREAEEARHKRFLGNGSSAGSDEKPPVKH